MNEEVIFSNVKECANANPLGITEQLLLLAREKIKSLAAVGQTDLPIGTRGFHASGRIYWTQDLQKWLEANQTELNSVDEGETYEHWRLREKRAKALNEEFELEEKYKRVVKKSSVCELLDRIATAQVSLVNGRLRQEFPLRFNLSPEEIQHLEVFVKDFLEVHSRGVDAWK